VEKKQIKHKTNTRLRKLIADNSPIVGRAGNDTGVREQVAILRQLTSLGDQQDPIEIRLKMLIT
jgi:hypothetical protein